MLLSLSLFLSYLKCAGGFKSYLMLLSRGGAGLCVGVGWGWGMGGALTYRKVRGVSASSALQQSKRPSWDLTRVDCNTVRRRSRRRRRRCINITTQTFTDRQTDIVKTKTKTETVSSDVRSLTSGHITSFPPQTAVTSITRDQGLQTFKHVIVLTIRVSTAIKTPDMVCNAQF